MASCTSPKHLTLRVITTIKDDKSSQESSASQTAQIITRAPRKRIKYTPILIAERGRQVHGDKYDYSAITDAHIQEGAHSKIPVMCNICKYQWSPTINKHLNERTGCPDCAKQVSWTLERLLKKGPEVHGDKIDYSQIKDEHVRGKDSKIPLICNTCKYHWNPSLHHHIRGNGCPRCAGNAPWTIQQIYEVGRQIHGDKYDYGDITDIQNAHSKIPIRCRRCDHRWSPTIHNHINGKTGCPNCSGHVPWTLERFIKRGSEIHGEEAFDYSAIMASDIDGVTSKVRITCRVCNYHWSPSIHGHINRETGCPNCDRQAPWTLEALLIRAKKVHGNRYDHGQITVDHIHGAKSRIPVICCICGYNWTPTIVNHINKKSGCPKCNRSKGELACGDVLTARGIIHEAEFVLKDLPRKRYDFSFQYEERKYLLEFDGIQHFEISPFFYNNAEKLDKSRKTDLLKTQKGIDSGYYIIRIDYTQIDKIAQHIENGINTETSLYVSNPERYANLINGLRETGYI